MRSVGDDRVVRTTSLEAAQGARAAAMASIPVEVPARVGGAEWEVAFPEQEAAGSLHEECAATVAATVVPHRTSLAVWGVPSPTRGTTFEIHVGVKCSEGCNLAGQLVEVRDAEGGALGVVKLLGRPREGTESLYEGVMALTAPDSAGIVARSAAFSPNNLELPHEGAEADFTFRCLDPPEYKVSVRVEPEDVECALAGIDVRLGAYKARTDSDGVASLGVPGDAYQLIVWRQDIEPVTLAIEVSRDTEVEVQVVPRRVVDADEERMWM